MDPITRISNLAAGILVVSVGYFLYRVPQRLRLRPDVSLWSPIDDLIPFRPSWVWTYLVLYYAFIAAVMLVVPSRAEFMRVSSAFFLMLAMHVPISLLLPVRVPQRWRASTKSGDVSERLLSRIQVLDKGGNCFPSMHVAVTILCMFLLVDMTDLGMPFGIIIYTVPVLVSASTVLTKQHFFADIPAGALLGCLGWQCYLGDWFSLA